MIGAALDLDLARAAAGELRLRLRCCKQKESSLQLLVVADKWTGGDGPERPAIILLALILLREQLDSRALNFRDAVSSSRELNPHRKNAAERRGRSAKTQWVDVPGGPIDTNTHQ